MNNINKSVKSIHLCKSVIETMYDIVKAHGNAFIFQLPTN